MSIFKGQQIVSNHGTKQGIIPRFWLQTMELAESTFGKENGNKIISKFFPQNLGDFTNFYDIFQEINLDYTDFINGLQNGQYFSITDKGEFNLDNSVELKMEKKIKDFFILGRLLINNFAKSQILESDNFDLNKYMIVKDSNFTKNRNEYLANDASKKFIPLIHLIEDARNNFLTDFNQIRADIEHINFQVPKFQINTEDGSFIEPSINGNQKLIQNLSFFYENLLEMMEKIIALFFAIVAISKNPNLGLFIQTNFDYSKTISKYVILPRIMNTMQNLKLIM